MREKHGRQSCWDTTWKGPTPKYVHVSLFVVIAILLPVVIALQDWYSFVACALLPEQIWLSQSKVLIWQIVPCAFTIIPSVGKSHIWFNKLQATLFCCCCLLNLFCAQAGRVRNLLKMGASLVLTLDEIEIEGDKISTGLLVVSSILKGLKLNKYCIYS